MTATRVIREMPPEQALELARNAATAARELAAQAGEQLAEALTRYNLAGGETARTSVTG